MRPEGGGEERLRMGGGGGLVPVGMWLSLNIKIIF